MTDLTPSPEYIRYCKAWRIYMDMESDQNWSAGRELRSKRFFTLLGDWLRSNIEPPYAVLKWPGNWPEVDILFGGQGKFTEGVEWVLEQQGEPQ